MRIVAGRNTGRAIAGALTARFLREIFPPTMNVQLSVDLRELQGGRFAARS